MQAPRLQTAQLPESEVPELSPSSSFSSLSGGCITPPESLSSETSSEIVGLGLDIALERLAEAGTAYYASQAHKASFPQHMASSLYASGPSFEDYGPHSPIRKSYISEWQQDVSSSLWSDPDLQYSSYSKPSQPHFSVSPAAQFARQLDQAVGIVPHHYAPTVVEVVEEEEEDDDMLSDEEVAILMQTTHRLRTQKRASQDSLLEEARLASPLLVIANDEQELTEEWHSGFVEWRRRAPSQLAVLRRDLRAEQLAQEMQVEATESIHDRVVSGEDLPLRYALGVSSVLQHVEKQRKAVTKAARFNPMMQPGLSAASFLV